MLMFYRKLLSTCEEIFEIFSSLWSFPYYLFTVMYRKYFINWYSVHHQTALLFCCKVYLFGQRLSSSHV